MRKFSYALSLLVIMCFSTAAYAQEIGHVTAIEGEVFKVVPNAQIALNVDTPILLNDEIMTQGDASITITFIDETVLALGAETQLIIDEYIFDPNAMENNKAIFSVMKGPFHYVSGLIAKKEKPDVTLNLDFGSIGIRGTKIWRDMTMTDDGKPQCRIYVEDGSVRVYNDQGFTTVNNGEGSRIVGRNNPPTSSKPWGEAAITDIKSKSPVIVTASSETEQPITPENKDTSLPPEIEAPEPPRLEEQSLPESETP